VERMRGNGIERGLKIKNKLGDRKGVKGKKNKIKSQFKGSKINLFGK
jgi:hypothetical protein